MTTEDTRTSQPEPVLIQHRADTKVTRRPRAKKRFGRVSGLVLVAPLLVAVALFVIVPVGNVIRYSFTRWDGISPPVGIGLANYRYLLDDAAFHRVLLNSVILVAGIVVWVALPFLLAVILFGRRGSAVIRAILFVPVLLPPIVAGTIFRLVLAEDGPLNEALRSIGLGALARDWLQSSTLVLPAVIAVIAWATVGTGVLLYSAGLSQIPSSLIEAAKIDGASWTSIVRHVYRPALRPVTRFWVILLIVTTVNGVFPWIYGLTLGGPGVASTTIDYEVYESGIVGGVYGVGSAIAVVGLAFVAIVFGVLALARVSSRATAGRLRERVSSAMERLVRGYRMSYSRDVRLRRRAAGPVTRYLDGLGAGSRLALVAAAVIAALFPLLWVIRVAMRPVSDFAVDPTRVAGPWTIANFHTAWIAGGLGRGLLISLLTVPAGAAVATAIAVIAGYSLAKLDIPARPVILGFIMAGIAVPLPAIVIPLFDQGLHLGYANSYSGLILVYGCLFASWGAYFLYRHFAEVPDEIIESARVDGAGPIRILISVVLPSSWPAIASVLVLNIFIASSNLILPLVFMTLPNSQPAIVDLALYNGQYVSGGPLSAAGAIIVALPVLAIYLIAQRSMRANVFGGAVKG